MKLKKRFSWSLFCSPL